MTGFQIFFICSSLVEDDRGIVANLTEFLTAEGFQVKSASGQASALKLLESERFVPELTDINLCRFCWLYPSRYPQLPHPDGHLILCLP